MADDNVELLVNGLRYGGWKSIRVTRSIESIAGSFELTATNRWGAGNLWTIAEEDRCVVEIDGIRVIDGYIDKRSLSASKEERTLAYAGRDRAAALVDNSAIVRAGTAAKNKWTFYNVDLVAVVTAIAGPHGIPVSVQPGLSLAELTKEKRIVLTPGDTCFEVISKLAAAAGVLVVSDAAGGIVITRAGTSRAASLVEGENILAAQVEYDATERFYRYLISSAVPTTDEAFGEDARIKAEAFDEGVRRKGRVLLIRPDKSYNTAAARGRADWEARIRAARAERVSVTVLGWKQPNGTLWPVNALTRVRATELVGVDGDMLISQVEHSVNESGRITQLSLVRPDAFTPEPTATVKQSSGGAWKELARGGL